MLSRSVFSGVGGDKLTADGGWSSASAGIASYTWEQVDSNGGIVWSSTTDEFVPLALPEVTEDTDFTVQLTITDTNGATDTATADIGYVYVEPNLAPVPVIAAPDEMNMSGSFTADGSGSSDTDGTIVTYLWEQIDNSGATVTIDSPNAESTSVTLPEVTEDTAITMQLTVTDDFGAVEATTKDIVIKFIDNELPVAVIYGDAEANMGTTLTLDGTGSSDADGAIVSYAWTQCDSSGITLTIDNADTDTASIVLPDVTEDTAVSVCLVVTDDQNSTSVQAKHDFVITFVEEVACEDTELVIPVADSYLPNASFDANTSLPNSSAQLERANGWTQFTTGTSDYFHADGFKGDSSPSPNGGGYIGFFINVTHDPFDEGGGVILDAPVYEYVGQVVDTPLVAGTEYLLNLYVGGGSVDDSITNPAGDRTVVIYGAPTAVSKVGDGERNNQTMGHIVDYANIGAVELGRATVSVSGTNWERVSISFTPSFDVATVILGGETTNTVHGKGTYLCVDDLQLNKKEVFTCP